MQSHTIPVNRTARYYTRGVAGPEAKELWFVLHGYGQLARYFIRHFEVIDDGTRLIVAPEALSRFYLSRHPERVGATWMTREDRENEIADYLAYLNQLAAHMLDLVERWRIPITVLGFSQGAATASRWVTLGRLPARRFILWAGAIAHDLDLARYAEVLSEMDLTFVVGDRDPYVTPEKLAAERERLDTHRIPYTLVPFEGEHRLAGTLLAQIAAQGRD